MAVISFRENETQLPYMNRASDTNITKYDGTVMFYIFCLYLIKQIILLGQDWQHDRTQSKAKLSRNSSTSVEYT